MQQGLLCADLVPRVCSFSAGAVQALWAEPMGIRVPMSLLPTCSTTPEGSCWAAHWACQKGPAISCTQQLLPDCPSCTWSLDSSELLPQTAPRTSQGKGWSGPSAALLPMEAVGTLPSTPTELSPIILDDCGEGFSTGPVGWLMTVSVVWIANVSQSFLIPSARPLWGSAGRECPQLTRQGEQQSSTGTVTQVCGRQQLCLPTTEQRGLKEPRPLSFPAEIQLYCLGSISWASALAL